MISTPCAIGRWPTFAFGILGDSNTCLFRDSACTSHSSRRLFFEGVCIALKQALSDTEAGVAIGMSAHVALWAVDQARTGSVAFYRALGIIANDLTMTAMAFSTGIARIHASGYDLLVICLIFGEPENPPFHPESSFHIATARILALFWTKSTQVLEDEDGCLVLLGKLNNASADQMSNLLIDMADFVPEVGIVLFAFGNGASQ